MNFLADQDVYGSTVRFLQALGHEVTPASRLGLAQAEDIDLLRLAQQQGRLMVTRDRDYGALAFVQGSGAGIVYLRVLPSTQDAVHSELARALLLYTEAELRSSLLVVEPGRHRIRRIEPSHGHQEPNR